MINVVYQYLAGQSKRQELMYSLRSLETHLQEDFKVWIVGDKPDWLINVVHIPHTRVDSGWCNNCYDATSKLELAINHPEMGADILWMYDDMYFLKDMYESMLSVYLAVNHSSNNNHKSSGVHKELLNQTFKALEASGKTTWNCETHTPRLYSKTLLQDIFKKYNPKENRYLTATLYFNDLFNDHISPHVMNKEDHYKAGFYGVEDQYSFNTKKVSEIVQILSGKFFLNHNDDGFSVSLVKLIETRFPDKSSFEK